MTVVVPRDTLRRDGAPSVSMGATPHLVGDEI
jgi:hypothetical protein